MSNIDRLIDAEHKRRGIKPNIQHDVPAKALPEDKEAYDGMRFFVNVNEAVNGESVTVHVIHGTWSRRENKRRLRMYLAELGYTRHEEQKQLLKQLGFWTKTQLGTQP